MGRDIGGFGECKPWFMFFRTALIGSFALKMVIILKVDKIDWVNLTINIQCVTIAKLFLGVLFLGFF